VVVLLISNHSQHTTFHTISRNLPASNLICHRMLSEERLRPPISDDDDDDDDDDDLQSQCLLIY